MRCRRWKRRSQPVSDQFSPLQAQLEDSQAEARVEYDKLQRLGENFTAKIIEISQTIDEKTKSMATSIKSMQDVMNQAHQRVGVDAQSKIEMDVRQD